MAGPNIYDQIISGTFANPAMQTSGWGKPAGNAQPYSRQGTSGVNFNPGEGFVPGAIPTSRLPQGTAGLPAPAGTTGMTPQQVQALGGWAVDPRTGQLAYSQPGAQNPAVAAAAQQAQNVPLPRPRPPNAPSWMDMAAINAPPQGANPGMGGAMIGSGQMSPQIPPQGPPPPGIAPTVWAGEQPQQQGGPLNITVRGGRPGGTVQRANGTNGYIYGRAAGGPWNQQGSNRAPGIGPAQQYAAATLMGQVNALNRQANATGQTGVYQYQSGQRTGTVGGVSPSQAYETAAASSRDPGTSGEGGNPSWW